MCAVVIGISMAYRLKSRQAAIRAEVQETLTAIADLKVGQIANWYRERKGDAAVVFNTPMIAGQIRQFLAHPSEGESRQSLFTWMSTLQQQSNYKVVALYDAQGVERLAAPEGLVETNLNIGKNANHALRSKTPILLDLHKDSSNGPIDLCLLIPMGLKPHPDQPAEAVIVLQVDPYSFLYPLVQTWPKPSSTAETLLVRREDNEVLFLNELRHRTNTALALRWSLADTNLPAGMAVQGREGIIEGTDYRGVPVLAALRKVAGTPWALVSKMDRDEVYQPLHRQARMTGLIGAFAMLSITLGFILVWRQRELAHSRRELDSRKETEETVRQSEQQFRQLVEANPDAIFIQTERRFTYVNDAAIRLFGATDARELLGQAILDRIHPDHREGVKTRIKDLNEQKLSPPRIEETCLKMDGTPVPCEISAVPLRYKGSDGAIVFAHDITERKKSEEVLRQSEEQMRLFFERQIVGMAIISPQQGWLKVNDSVCKMLGYSRDELIRMTWAELTHPDDLARDEVQFGRLLEGEISEYSLEKRYIRKDGAVVVANLSVGCVRKSDGAVDYILALVNDITERKRAEQGLRESEARYRSLFENMIEGFAYCLMLFDVNGQPDDFIYLEVNGAFESMTGLKNVAGRPVSEVIPGIRTTDPDLLKRYGQVAHSGIPDRFEIYVSALKMWFDLAVYCPARGYFVAVFDVINARKETELALKDSEERFHRAVVHSPFPILLHAEDGAIIQASQSWYEITGYTPEELVNVGDWTERAYGQRKNLVKAEIDKLYGLDRRVVEGDHNIRTRDGSTRIWDFSSAPLGRLPDGRRLVISMAMDVTERRKAEGDIRQLNVELEQRVRERTALLEAANKELESFSYSISHDLRAPLRHISGFMDLLEKHVGGQLDDLGRQYIRHVSSASKDMTRLIESLLNFSRMGRVNIKWAQVDMEGLVRESIATLDQELVGRRVEWHFGPLPHVTADHDLMKLVWMNLIGNAVKYTRGRDPAWISIHCEDRESEAASGVGAERVFSVRDNGAGFDMEYAQKLFGVFQRLHRQDEFEGTGIGLANVHRIITRHGGRIWAEAKVNEGAVFYFSLPNRTDVFMT